MKPKKFKVWDTICQGWSNNTMEWHHNAGDCTVTPGAGRYLFLEFTGLYDANGDGRELKEDDLLITSSGIVYRIVWWQWRGGTWAAVDKSSNYIELYELIVQTEAKQCGSIQENPEIWEEPK